jgi:hypothetical protein
MNSRRTKLTKNDHEFTQMGKRGIRVYSCSFVVGLFFSLTAPADEVSLRLARALSAERDHAGASIEFRRLALSAGVQAERAAFHWSAAYEVWKAGDAARADKVLDAAEDAQGLSAADLAALRGELALAQRRPAEAAFHFEALAREADPEVRAFGLRKQAAALLQAGQPADARRVAADAGPEAGAALQRYAEGRDKRPALGGWLGVVPGLGYAYAGEYANAARSLILNSLFLWGMVETAEDEEWGAFAALTFFEITWYSGSIYGGIDASHRYNQRRLNAAIVDLTSGYELRPDYEALPALRVRYRW